LATVADIKGFAVQSGLLPTESYARYAELDRPFAVWVVSASEPLGFRAKEWHFPIVGSVPYLGWFDRDDAIVQARRLSQAGWDVDVRGASAYSTLGWFDDPVLSTMISNGPEALGELANTVLHESVHATLYVNSQSIFNESLADFVANRLTRDYMRARLGESAPETRAYMTADEEGERRSQRLYRTYQELRALYSSRRSVADKLQTKRRILAAVGDELGFRRPINNATLVQFRTYHAGARELGALFEACGERWTRFWSALRSLGPSSFATPQTEDLSPVLMPLVRSQCAVRPS
jgi:predicted aminopeptidase